MRGLYSTKKKLSQFQTHPRECLSFITLQLNFYDGVTLEHFSSSSSSSIFIELNLEIKFNITNDKYLLLCSPMAK